MLEFLGALLVVLLTMVSYAAGVTLAAGRRDYEPSLTDLLLVAALWLLLFWLRPQMARWPLLAFIIFLGIIVGALFGGIRLGRQNTAVIIPKSELPAHAREDEAGRTAVAGNLFKRGWHRWSDFAGRMGAIQGRLLMGFFYFLVITPFGLVARLFTDSLAIKKEPEKTNWKAKEQSDLSLEAAAEQG